MFNIGSIVATLKANISGFASAMGQVKQYLDGVKAKVREVASTLSGFAVAGTALLYGLARGFMDVVNEAVKYQNALLGLSSVAKAFGESQGEATKAAQMLASDGLMTVTDAARGLKNLLAAGYGLDDAIVLMTRFKDSAAFARQGSLSFGEAIAGATEGIKNGNSILVDNAGVTKNLSIILEEAGYSAQDLMKATTDAGVRQAIFNGILKETNPQLGDAARLANSAAGEQAKFAAKTTTAKQALGEAFQPILGQVLAIFTPLVQIIPKFSNQIIAGAAAVFVAVSAFVALVAVLKLVILLSSPIMLVFALIAALVGYSLYKAFEKMQGQLKATAKTTQTSMDDIGDSSEKNLGKVQELSQDTIDKLAEIDDQMAKTTRNFKDDLADMVRSHQAKVKELTTQIDEENATFAEASKETEQDNKEKLDQMAEDHSKKTESIRDDINAEVAKGRMADQDKLASLRAMLATEETEYADKRAKEEAKMAEDTAKALAEHNKRLADTQAKLDEETALLAKHEQDVQAVKDVAAKDEIDKLKEKYAEQMAQYELDKQKALKADGEKSASFNSSTDNMVKQARKAADDASKAFEGINGSVDAAGIGGVLGGDMARSFLTTFVDVLKETIVGMWYKVGDWMADKLKGIFPFNILIGGARFAGYLSGGMGAMDALKTAFSDIFPGFADGIRNFSGGWAITGERGPELVKLPGGSSVYSNSDSRRMLASQNNGVQPAGGNTEVNISISAGAFMGTPGEARQFAERIDQEIQRLQIIRGKAAA